MKEYKVYTPWASIIVEAKNEKDAQVKALQQIICEVESASPTDLDAEEQPTREYLST